MEFALLVEFRFNVLHLVVDERREDEESTNEDAEKGAALRAETEAVDFDEDDWEGFEPNVQEAVDLSTFVSLYYPQQGNDKNAKDAEIVFVEGAEPTKAMYMLSRKIMGSVKHIVNGRTSVIWTISLPVIVSPTS